MRLVRGFWFAIAFCAAAAAQTYWPTSITLSMDSSVQGPSYVTYTVTVSPPVPQWLGSFSPSFPVEIADSQQGCTNPVGDGSTGCVTLSSDNGNWVEAWIMAGQTTASGVISVDQSSQPTVLSFQIAPHENPPSNVAMVQVLPTQVTMQVPAVMTGGSSAPATVTLSPANDLDNTSVCLLSVGGLGTGAYGGCGNTTNSVYSTTVVADDLTLTTQTQWKAQFEAGHGIYGYPPGPYDYNGVVIYQPLTVFANNTADLGPPSHCSTEAICGSPINLTNGNTYIQQRDYSIPGLAGGMQLTRTWNSLWASNSPWETSGMFGDSWQSNFEQHLQAVSGGEKYWRGDGSAWMFTYNSTSQVYSLTSPPDERANLAFNSSTSQFTVTLADGTQRIFSQPGYLLSIVDRNGNQTTLTYDSSNRVTKVTDAAARVLTFNYANSSLQNLATSIQDAVGTVATYGYDTSRHLTSVTYADGSAINFNYDANGLIASTTDSQGRTLESHTYDSVRQGLTSQRANGVDSIAVGYTGSTATLSDSAGNSTQYTVGTRISGRNFLTGIAGSGCDTCGGRGNYAFAYDSAGNRTSSTDPLGHLTKYFYDSNGNVTARQIQSDSTGNNFQTWNYTYNGFNEVLTATDPLGHQTVNTYDSKGNLLTTTTPSPGGSTAGSKTTFTYDTKGELTSITDPNKNKTSIFYTTAGLIDHITDAQTHTTTFKYDARGNRTAIIDANNQQTTFGYDSMNRLTKITYPTSPATFTQFAYDYRGRKSSLTDPNGKITQYGYDDADRLVSVTDSNSGITQYGYDNESNLTSISDAVGHQTTFQYDPYGHVTQAAFPSSFAETYSYDLDGNLLTKMDRNGHLINYSYDFLNRLTSKSYPNSTAVSYTYDLANRLAQVSDPTGTYSLSYDNMNRLTQTSTAYSFITGKTFTVGYGYDANSNRTSMADPQNAATAYVYDTLNRMTTLTYPTRTNYTFTYDAVSRRTQLTRPNSLATNYQYDTLSRLTSVLHQITTKSGNTTLDGATYLYDAAGNRTSKTDKRTNATSTFSYDPLYELTQVLQGSTTTESYSYDAVGNRLSSLGVSPYNYNNSNELTSTPSATYTYDNNGNTLTKADSTGTTQYNWDFENRLTSVVLPGSGGTASFKYDPFGRRIQKSSSSGLTNYVYDGPNALEEVDGSGNVLARYTQATNVDDVLAEVRGGTTSYYEIDGLGSVTSLTTSAGSVMNTYTYNGFGKLAASTGTIPNSYLYTGRESDNETGLYYYRARYYDPNTGRFLSEDPISFQGGIDFYAYVLNRPVGYVDPAGLDPYSTYERTRGYAGKLPCIISYYACAMNAEQTRRSLDAMSSDAVINTAASSTNQSNETYQRLQLCAAADHNCADILKNCPKAALSIPFAPQSWLKDLMNLLSGNKPSQPETQPHPQPVPSCTPDCVNPQPKSRQ
jgi:RHS repeat-associated protein